MLIWTCMAVAVAGRIPGNESHLPLGTGPYEGIGGFYIHLKFSSVI